MQLCFGATNAVLTGLIFFFFKEKRPNFLSSTSFCLSSLTLFNVSAALSPCSIKGAFRLTSPSWGCLFPRAEPSLYCSGSCGVDEWWEHHLQPVMVGLIPGLGVGLFSHLSSCLGSSSAQGEMLSSPSHLCSSLPSCPAVTGCLPSGAREQGVGMDCAPRCVAGTLWPVFCTWRCP